MFEKNEDTPTPIMDPAHELPRGDVPKLAAEQKLPSGQSGAVLKEAPHHTSRKVVKIIIILLILAGVVVAGYWVWTLNFGPITGLDIPFVTEDKPNDKSMTEFGEDAMTPEVVGDAMEQEGQTMTEQVDLSTWPRYNAQAMGFSVQYPPAWIVVATSPQDEIYIGFDLQVNQDLVCFDLNCQLPKIIFEKHSGQSVDDFIDTIQATTQRILGQSETTITGKIYTKLLIEQESKDQVLNYLYADGDDLFIISNRDTSDAMVQTLEDLLTTFEIGVATTETDLDSQEDMEVDSEVDAAVDTDGDGLPDEDELIIWNSDPENPDTDDDGLSDYEEIFTWATDPSNPDTDGDSYPDGVEVANSYDPLGPGKGKTGRVSENE
jgi:hypothetical protein